MSETSTSRRWRRAAILVVTLLLIGVGLHRLLGKILLGKIQTAVQKNLNANLSADTLSYRPPYTFVLPHFHFVLPHHDAPPDIIDAAELKVTFDRLPFGGGPVLIKSLQLIDPVVQIAKSPDNIVDLQSLSGGSESEQPNKK